MRANLTEVICIIDASGSMNHLATDTVGGFNSFIEKQKQDEGETRVTLVTFDSNVKTHYEQKDVNEVEQLTVNDYMMGGMTSLLDAIGMTLTNVGNRLAKTAEDDKPSKVIVMITTDGQENSSREYRRDKIKEMIKEQTDKYSWQFLFAGANIDSVAEAGSLGIDSNFAVNYTHTGRGVGSVYNSLSAVTSLSKKGAVADDMSVCFKSSVE